MRFIKGQAPPRRGVTSILAMMFLLLLAVLALGFYAATTVNVQVAHSDTQAGEAIVAADSGMAFLRYQLSKMQIPPGTAPDQLIQAVYDDLSARMNGSDNLAGGEIGFDGSTVSIPAGADDYVMLADDSGRFRATITASAGRLSARVTGRHRDPAITRSVKMSFNPSPRQGIFDYAIASKGVISTSGSSRIYGSPLKTTATMLSADKSNAYPIQVGGKEIGGDLSIVNASADVRLQSGSVGGSDDADDIVANHIHKGVPEPEFPTVDISVFTGFVSKPYTDPAVQSRAPVAHEAMLARWSPREQIQLAKGGNGGGNGGGGNGGGSGGGSGGGTTYTNCYVPANANPTFNASDIIQGVLYIKAPNQVKFAGGCTIRGVIVVENNPQLAPGDTLLDFRGNVEVYGVETLDPVQFAQLRALTGSFILAENAAVDFKGNFTTEVSGSIIAGSVSFGGSAGGSVNGSIIGMNASFPMSLSNANSSPIVFTGTAKTNPPSGLNFSTYFKADPTSYLEVEK